MKDNVKRVFYVRQLAHPCYLDIIAQRPEIRIDKLENDTPDASAQPILAAAHAYQIGSARDELQIRYHAQRDLLERMPNLLIISTGGAGFDTVNVQRLHRGGGAGGQPVRRQCRCGGLARARHGADAVEADHPDQPCLAARHDQ